MLSSAVFAENIFARPGIGKLIVDAVNIRNYPVVQGAVLTTVALFAFAMPMADLIVAWLDPRVRSDILRSAFKRRPSHLRAGGQAALPPAAQPIQWGCSGCCWCCWWCSAPSSAPWIAPYNPSRSRHRSASSAHPDRPVRRRRRKSWGLHPHIFGTDNIGPRHLQPRARRQPVSRSAVGVSSITIALVIGLVAGPERGLWPALA